MAKKVDEQLWVRVLELEQALKEQIKHKAGKWLW